jgi:predicted ATPase
MNFTVLDAGERVPANVKGRAFLITDEWDDWFEFSTLYNLVLVDEDGARTSIGGVKIGQFEMPESQRRPGIRKQFPTIGEKFFSLGQDDSYYEALNRLGDAVRDQVLKGLRDIAADAALYEDALRERVTRISLLRSVSPMTVRGQFARLARGDARLTRYDFVYEAPVARSSGEPLNLSFTVEPDVEPPTNIHVLIGRNGVGKTRILRLMSRALVDNDPETSEVGSFDSDDDSETGELFANVVSVSFSAFDSFEPLLPRKDASVGIRYSYVGLQRRTPKTGPKAGKPQPPKSPAILKNEFVDSVEICRMVGKVARWRRALETLEADPLFREAEVTTLADAPEDEWSARAGSLFTKLSSGHAIVLLTITRLVETVDERTLVLLDEPEAHLHPPLLSAFVRALSDLLVQRNAVAIVATHSPVVLQEVPKSCVWKLRRSGSAARAERPGIETFGENLGILSREAFGLEVTDAGFHRLVSTAVEEEGTYRKVCERFGEQLGAEARAIARGLAAVKAATESE